MSPVKVWTEGKYVIITLSSEWGLSALFSLAGGQPNKKNNETKFILLNGLEF